MNSISLGPLKDMSVLLAEDDLNMRESMGRALGVFFGNVLLAENGRQAMDLFLSGKPHLAVLDITMPAPDGLEVAGFIREHDPDLPVIILTGHSDISYMQKAVRLRLMDYLIKPVSMPALEKALDSCLKEMKKRGRLDIRLEGGGVLNITAGTVAREGDTHLLTANERQLLKILLGSRGRMIGSLQICLAMSCEKDFTPQALRNLVWRLRPKIGKEAISSSRELGYMLK